MKELHSSQVKNVFQGKASALSEARVSWPAMKATRSGRPASEVVLGDAARTTNEAVTHDGKCVHMCAFAV